MAEEDKKPDQTAPGAAPPPAPAAPTEAESLDTPNLFKYVSGDTVASSNRSTGATLYTMSLIANVSQTTPGGAYGTSLFVRAIPVY